MNETVVTPEQQPLPPPAPAGTEQTQQKLKLVKERVHKESPPPSRESTRWTDISI